MKASMRFYGFMALNEALNTGAGLILSFAYLLAPFALVQLTTSFQPLFVFLIGIFLTVFLPGFNMENTDRRFLIQKLLFIIIMLFGSYLLFT